MAPATVKEIFEELRAFDPDSPEARSASRTLIEPWVDRVALPFVDYVENQPPQSDIWGVERPPSHLPASGPIGAIACEHTPEGVTRPNKVLLGANGSTRTNTEYQTA